MFLKCIQFNHFQVEEALNELFIEDILDSIMMPEIREYCKDVVLETVHFHDNEIRKKEINEVPLIYSFNSAVHNCTLQ